jgi:tetratricopeptide (TPR) repeat protein
VLKEQPLGDQSQQLTENQPQFYSEQQSLLNLLKPASPPRLYEVLLKLAHIIRVWLLLPQQALFFYQQALELSQGHHAQTYFFIGITMRSLQLPDEAIKAYQKALEINPLYSDCYFNLGNIYFEDKNDFQKAEICHKSALESLEENKKIEMYRRLEE